MSDQDIAQRVAERYAAGTGWNAGQVRNNIGSMNKAVAKISSAAQDENAAAVMNGCSSLVAIAARTATAASGDKSLAKASRALSDKIHAAAKDAPTAKEARTILGPDWTPDEERLLGKLSAEGYNHANNVRDFLMKRLGELRRTARSDADKKRVLDEIEKQVTKANMALNQVGYNARRTFDDRH